jgi:hypothetical protein
MQWLYLVAATLGTVLPLSQLIPFLMADGFDIPLLFRQLSKAMPLASSRSM